MSCYMCSSHEISFLIFVLREYGVSLHPYSNEEIGKALWKENRKSVNFRYKERKRTPKFTMRIDPVFKRLICNPFLVIKIVHHYEYQSCEHKTWKRSKPFLWMRNIKEIICKNVGLSEDDIRNTDQWEREPWGLWL